MHKWTALLFAALVLGAGTWVIVENARHTAKALAQSDAGAPDASATDVGDAGAPLEDGEAPAEHTGEPADPTQAVDAGGTLLLSGEAAPALPADAPKSVVFGVVLVWYRGAQGPPGASRVPEKARSRAAALTMAKELAELAKTDFKAAVGKGDKPGLLENAGRIPRGVLEPAPEYVLFSLAKGGVSEPVDTPRGYWVVTRIE